MERLLSDRKIGSSCGCWWWIIVCCLLRRGTFVTLCRSLYCLKIYCHWIVILIIKVDCGFHSLLICRLLLIRSCVFFMSFACGWFRLVWFWGCQFLILRKKSDCWRARMSALICHRRESWDLFIVMIWWDCQSFVWSWYFFLRSFNNLRLLWINVLGRRY